MQGFRECGERIAKIYQSDKDGVHFLWKCTERRIVHLGGIELVTDPMIHPLHFMRSRGYIDPQYMALFDVFASSLEEGMADGIDKSGQYIDLKMRLRPDEKFGFCHFITDFLKDENNRITDMVVHIRRFNDKEKLDKEILDSFSSDKDPELFDERIRKLMKKNPDKGIAFIQFDVERFKLINSVYGNDVGDELLRFFGDSMEVLCGDGQVCCRLTADVFMAVIPYDDEKEIGSFIRSVESRLLGYNGMEYRLIFGVALVGDRELHTRIYSDRASVARQSVKGKAFENIAFYQEKMMKELRHRQIIEDDMHKAVVNDEFAMFLQPKYCISTGRIIGAEALARWIHPEKGMISPADFIPIFEKNGFISKLDAIIWEKACRQIRRWIDMGVTPVPISVNVSREYLQDEKVLDQLKTLVERYKVPIDYLELEITESIDGEKVEERIKQFKEAGFTMLMDDFGSGYSSLNMLKKTHFDVLKIDREFLSEFMESERGRKIISHTISMSRDIGLEIIAEGVETNDQAVFLYKCGCDAAQGFYYSKPVDCETFDSIFISKAV